MSLRSTSFARPTRARPVLAAALAWGLAAAAVAALVWTAVEARRLERLAVGLGVAAADLRLEIEATRGGVSGPPSAAEFEALRGRVERLNALAGPRAEPLPALLEALERAVPDGVWLSQLTYDAGTGAFTASLLSEDEARLPAALRAVEGIEALGSVILERQVRLRQGRRAVVQYDVRARARGGA